MGNFIMSIIFLACLVVIFITTCNCLENIFKEDSSEEDRSVFKYALTLLILVLLSNALWFGIVQEL